MEIQEFAEKILFSTSLEEKLSTPDTPLTDTSPNKAFLTPDAPGRPENLIMRKDGIRINIPGEHQLESDHDRGILLHFLANHELLATELMALVLLKFPEAPKAFRKGILRTLQEEQEHTKIYLERMKECGINFGDIPVNGFFWNAVAPMETPLDYVTRLSLTFEQANLDFSKYYGQLFRKNGDEATGAILDQIYKDEIAHVGYGLKWFRRWKKQDDDDFTAFKSQLPFPLSPARAKGDHLHFNKQGRRDAGLTEEFIQQLQLYRQSKGRTPRVYLYNPDAERQARHLINETSTPYQPTKILSQMTTDLDTLPIALAKKDDIVIVKSSPTTWLREHWHSHGIIPPEFITEDDNTWLNRKLDSLVPWAWSQSSFDLISKHQEQWAHNASHPERWNKALAEPYGKSYDQTIKKHLSLPVEQLCDQPSDAINQINTLIETGPVVLKPTYSLAGNGFKIFRTKKDIKNEEIEQLFQDHATYIIEPWRERILDFSMQYEITKENILFKGKTILENNSRGQFISAHVGSSWGKGLPNEILRWINEKDRLHLYQDTIPELLFEKLSPTGFTGALGIDAYLFKNQETKEIELMPICEINPRVTMGRVALEMYKKTPSTPFGTLKFSTKPKEIRDQLLQKDSITLQNTIFLNDPNTATKTVCYYQKNERPKYRLG